MNNVNNYRLTSVELAVTLLSHNLAISILYLPRVLAKEMGTPDGWISVSISGVMMLVLILLYVRLQRKFPGRNLIHYFREGPIGKWGAKLFAIVLIIYWLIGVAILSRYLGMYVKMYLLDRTPSEIIVAVFLLTTTYAVTKGLQGVIHLCLLFTPFIIMVLIFILTINIGEMDIDQLRPVLAEGMVPVLHGIMPTTWVFFSGIIFFFLFMGFLSKEEVKSLPVSITTITTALFFIASIIACYASFGFETTKYITFPLIELGEVFEIPGGFIERPDALFMTIWIMATFTTVALGQLGITLVIKEQFLHNRSPLGLQSGLVFCIFIVSFIPNSFLDLEKWSGMMALFACGFMTLGIVLGYVTVWVRKRPSQKTNSF